ncbi:M15 family metallopeptidase [Cuneatibacter sp. NSJ-177]|uniref:M15 family metallopeptidase n=1 Tax=Cuneatibacter sp. NSJ-177 TaxID=2931401 RepID=UPI001FD41977|nr:M15 family metallopeptidase [Cuneatibacter sp. NSJ-177]MCJ7836060.1 M15 family metallopeptidase [Cuneatibacter sp. NSJ-177]
MRKDGKKKRIGIWVGIVLILLVIGAAAVLILRPDWRFWAKEQILAFFRKADWEEKEFEDSELLRVSPDELQEMDGIQWNDALYLVNRDHLIPSDKQFDLVFYKDTDVRMNACITEAYSRLSEKVKEATGDRLFVRSSYRDKEAQAAVLQENPETATEPGASEHETGLALDVYVSQYGGYGFLKSPAGQYVNSRCSEQGFIIRYPFGKSEITGVVHEPWHIRYVGIPHAELIYRRGQTLEEYLDSLEIGGFYQYGDSLITRQRMSEEIRLPKDGSSWTASEDGMGNVVLTGNSRKTAAEGG